MSEIEVQTAQEVEDQLPCDFNEGAVFTSE